MNVGRSNKKVVSFIKEMKQTLFHRNNDTNYTDDLALLANTPALPLPSWLGL